MTSAEWLIFFSPTAQRLDIVTESSVGLSPFSTTSISAEQFRLPQRSFWCPSDELLMSLRAKIIWKQRFQVTQRCRTTLLHCIGEKNTKTISESEMIKTTECCNVLQPRCFMLVPLFLIYLAGTWSEMTVQNVFTVGLVFIPLISTMLLTGALNALGWYIMRKILLLC